jgi:hypothetical protein
MEQGLLEPIVARDSVELAEKNDQNVTSLRRTNRRSAGWLAGNAKGWSSAGRGDGIEADDSSQTPRRIAASSSCLWRLTRLRPVAAPEITD